MNLKWQNRLSLIPSAYTHETAAGFDPRQEFSSAFVSDHMLLGQSVAEKHAYFIDLLQLDNL